MLTAFPSFEDLAQLTKFKLNVTLETIAGNSGTPLGVVMFRILEWAESHGVVRQLLEEARKEREDNLAFRQAIDTVVLAEPTVGLLPRVHSRRFDALVICEPEDIPSARPLLDFLEQQNCAVWLDPAGTSASDPKLPLLDALANSRLAIVVQGRSTTPRWQIPDVRSALEEFDGLGGRILPLAIGSGAALDAPPPFLTRLPMLALGSPPDPEVLSRVLWAVTDQKPAAIAAVTPPPQPPSDPGETPSDIPEITELLRSSDVTCFVGSGLLVDSSDVPPTPYAVAKDLLEKMNLLNSKYSCGETHAPHLLPPVDMAGTYYSVQTNRTALQRHIGEMIRLRSAVPAAGSQIAALLQALSGRRERRVRFERPRIVVTTNVDTSLERAFLAAGVPFSRIVQHTGEDLIAINDYRGISVAPDSATPTLRLTNSDDRELDPVPLSHTDEVDELIEKWNRVEVRRVAADSRSVRDQPSNPRFAQIDELPDQVQRTSRLAPRKVIRVDSLKDVPIRDLTTPILYKYRGSHDVPGSCAFSSEQYFDYGLRTLGDEIVPSEIAEILSGTYPLLIGYDLLDTDFRLLYYTLLRRYTRPEPKRWIVTAPPTQDETDNYRQTQRRLWARLPSLATTMQIGIIAMPIDDFLDQLIKGLTPPPSRS